jgi:hypothetical protein
MAYGPARSSSTVRYRPHRSVRGNALWICITIGWIGILGVLPDLDHLIDGMARQTHLLAIVVSCIPFCIFFTLYRRRVKVGNVIPEREDVVMRRRWTSVGSAESPSSMLHSFIIMSERNTNEIIEK